MKGQRVYSGVERKRKVRTWKRANRGRVGRKMATAARNRLRALRMRGEVPR